jgi:hypothetical protein
MRQLCVTFIAKAKGAPITTPTKP